MQKKKKEERKRKRKWVLQSTSVSTGPPGEQADGVC
jgi:hypothetical protein